MELIARRAGGVTAPIVSTRYCFQTVWVTAQEQSGSAGDEVPQETVKFAYGAVSQQYTPQSKTGTAGTSVFGNWNQTTNSLLKGESYPNGCNKPLPL